MYSCIEATCQTVIQTDMFGSTILEKKKGHYIQNYLEWTCFKGDFKLYLIEYRLIKIWGKSCIEGSKI